MATLGVSGMLLCAPLALGSFAGNGPPAGSGRGFGRGPIGDNRCYQVCPPVVYPTGHDPYYDSAFFTYEKELHGGPFGPGTLNPFNKDNPMNFAGHWPGVKQPIMPRSLPQGMPVNYYPGMGAATRFLQTSAYAGVRTRASESERQRARAHEQAHGHAQANALANMRAQAHAGIGSRARSRVHPKGVMCLHVCPKNKAARPDDEPLGGPFGPDPYYFRGKTMFNNKNGHSGFGSSASNFRNFQNEAYGGPFGPDPYYVSLFEFPFEFPPFSVVGLRLSPPLSLSPSLYTPPPPPLRPPNHRRVWVCFALTRPPLPRTRI
jgi:hypothetical protein